jgi:hypothetical protein
MRVMWNDDRKSESGWPNCIRRVLLIAIVVDVVTAFGLSKMLSQRKLED